VIVISSKYAFFGGSFDPIHNGHIIIVQYMLDFLKPEWLFVVPAGRSPFKTGKTDTADFESRYTWCERGFSGLNRVRILDIERGTDESSPAYTIDTLHRFNQRFGSYPTLILGEDALATFHKWKDYRKILELTKLAVFHRKTSKSKQSNTLESTYKDRILRFPTPIIEISSTEIRKRAISKSSLRGFVPESIEQGIRTCYSKKTKDAL